MLTFDDRYQRTGRDRIDRKIKDILSWQSLVTGDHFLHRLNRNILETMISTEEDFYKVRPFLMTFHDVLDALVKLYTHQRQPRSILDFSRVTDLGTEGDTLLFACCQLVWVAYNRGPECISWYHRKIETLTKWKHLFSPQAFSHNYRLLEEDFTCTGGKHLDLVFIRNTLHHMRYLGGWKGLIADLFDKVETGIYIKDPVCVRGLPAAYNEDYDNDKGKFLTILEARDLIGTYSAEVLPMQGCDDLSQVLDEEITEEFFSQRHQNGKNQPNIITVFIPGVKLR